MFFLYKQEIFFGLLGDQDFLLLKFNPPGRLFLSSLAHPSHQSFTHPYFLKMTPSTSAAEYSSSILVLAPRYYFTRDILS